MIDAFAESHGIPMNTVHCKAIFGQGLSTAALHSVFLYDQIIFISAFVVFLNHMQGNPITGFVGEVPVFLAKPQTYMNLSGESVRVQNIQFSF